MGWRKTSVASPFPSPLVGSPERRSLRDDNRRGEGGEWDRVNVVNGGSVASRVNVESEDRADL